MTDRCDGKPIPSLEELYPTLTDADRTPADENLERYVRLAWRISQRVIAGSPADPQDAVDEERRRSIP